MEPETRRSAMPRLPYPHNPDLPAAVADRLRSLPDLNVLRMLCHAPSFVPPWTDFANILMTELELAPELRELALLRVIGAEDCIYEWEWHRRIAESVGVTTAQIDALARADIDGPEFCDRERAVLRFVDEIRTRVATTDAAIDVLRRFLSDREIVELTVAVGFLMLVDRVVRTTGIESDSVEVLTAAAAPRA
ncbi:carboxymuconolactone decarboxylase family protein [Nocardia brasiliensis]